VLIGEERRWCYASAEWNWGVWGDAQCIPQDEYYARQAGMIAGIVLAVLIPIACIAFYVKRYVDAKYLQEEYDFRRARNSGIKLTVPPTTATA